MSAYDRVGTGIPELDGVIDNIRLGDNIVWQFASIEAYRFFVDPFIAEAVNTGRNTVYLRFAMHPPVVDEQKGVRVYQLDINSGFENFTIQVHKIIAEEGKETFYVFDCLSELQSAWAADLMMGNFFTITCPYLFEMDTIAYFAILRNRHSFDTIARIRETTQLLIDVYDSGTKMYVHPLKVWNRYSPTMFLPHVFDGGRLLPLTDGMETGKFFALIAGQNTQQTGQKLDYWDRIFIRAEVMSDPENDDGESSPANPEMLERLCKLVIGREKSILELALKHFTLRDLIKIKDRMIGSGYIGGKAVGMLLARRMAEGCGWVFETHDSFYIGSDVFYTFIVKNGWWRLRLEQRTDGGYFKAARQLKNRITGGTFPEIIREQFRVMLEYYGQNPIIVRSSSLLEDSFGNAFAGKYESIFLINSGSPEQRLLEFENAVKKVYASSMDESALVYRKQRGLDKSDEQMAVLIQRVSGSWYGDIFMPGASGVGYSYNTYAWSRDMDPDAGMVRMVLGLGTRAVDRTEGDYPRIASLDKPNLRLLANVGDKSRFSQHYADVLDRKSGNLRTMDINELSVELPGYLKELTLEHDKTAEALLAQRGRRAEYLLSTLDGLMERQDFIKYIGGLLAQIQQMYGYPVDIEFTVNFSPEGDFALNLLQCRPLQVKGLGRKVRIPQVASEDTFFEVQGSTMGGSIYQHIDKVVLIDPLEYASSNPSMKHKVARTVGKLNAELGRKASISVSRDGTAYTVSRDGSGLMLIGPGRWGTTTPELGVPVRFAEISNFRVLCELSFESAGLIPELSYGSHFFQDLVETDIFYIAIFPGVEGAVFRPEALSGCKNRLLEYLPESKGLEHIISVYDTAELGLTLLSDLTSGKTLCAFGVKIG